MRYVVYDIEVKKAVPPRPGALTPRVAGVDYCKGWGDHANMGVACVGVFESWTGRFRAFFEDNKEAFLVSLATADVAVGFNNIKFDDKVLLASKWWEPESLCAKIPRYDILRELWIAKGLNPEGFSKAHGGVGLDACARANGGQGKTGHGATAPIDYQQGRWGKLIDYCLMDVRLTQMLFEQIVREGYLCDPSTPGTWRALADPRTRVGQFGDGGDGPSLPDSKPVKIREMPKLKDGVRLDDPLDLGGGV